MTYFQLKKMEQKGPKTGCVEKGSNLGDVIYEWSQDAKQTLLTSAMLAINGGQVHDPKLRIRGRSSSRIRSTSFPDLTSTTRGLGALPPNLAVLKASFQLLELQIKKMKPFLNDIMVT